MFRKKVAKTAPKPVQGHFGGGVEQKASPPSADQAPSKILAKRKPKLIFGA